MELVDKVFRVPSMYEIGDLDGGIGLGDETNER